MLFPIKHFPEGVPLVFDSALPNVVLQVEVYSSPFDDLGV